MKQRSSIAIESNLQPVGSTMELLPVLAVFVILVLILIAFGLIELYSATYAFNKTTFFFKQLRWICIGFCAAGAILFVGTKKLSDWSLFIMFGLYCALGLALTFPPINGARRWIQLGSMSIQPSEFAKVGITLYLGKYLAVKSHAIEKYSVIGIWKEIFFVGIAILLVLMGEDLGTTVLLCVLCAALFFVSGVSPILLLSVALTLGGCGFFYIKNFDAMRWNRLTVYLDPEPLASDSGYQIWRSLLALGSGDWHGRGFGESILKLKYLPEAHTDFILAIVGEELGFITILAVIAFYLVITFLGLVISTRARTRQNKYIAFGMIIFIAVQALINIGVICAAFPTKGMPAPFISYGGSNILACIMAVACIVSVALDSIFPDYAERNAEKLKSYLLKPFRKTKTTISPNS